MALAVYQNRFINDEMVSLIKKIFNRLTPLSLVCNKLKSDASRAGDLDSPSIWTGGPRGAIYVTTLARRRLLPSGG